MQFYKVAGFSAVTATFATLGTLHLTGNLNIPGVSVPKTTPSPAKPTPAAVATPAQKDEMVALIGDVGGTNVRLTLRKLDLKSRTSSEIKPLTKIPSQGVKSFSEAVSTYLNEYEQGSENWPKVGVVGIAGEVKNNVVCTTNIPHWGPTDGKVLKQEFQMEHFDLINDFAAAGHGLCLLQEKDFERVNRNQVEENGVKVVLGPGTGHGQGFLAKSKFAPCHEVYPSEGGHVEFAARTEQEQRLLKFAYNFIENSDNVENKRAKAKIDRMSHERLGAGPAIPLIYEFLKTEYPTMDRVLESGDNAKTPDTLTSSDIINAGMTKKDPLCEKVVEMFADIFAAEAGDFALKTLPYGGIYLVGGVTMGIRDYILHDKRWINTFYNKGRLSSTMRRFPVMVLRPETELGILGAEEVAYRLAGSYSKQ